MASSRFSVLELSPHGRSNKLKMPRSSVFCDSQQRHWVQAITIDALAKERDLERVKLIIGDAEGAEPEVLTGAMETLKRTDFVSVCASAERRGQRTLEACEKILKDASFDIIHRQETGFCGGRKD